MGAQSCIYIYLFIYLFIYSDDFAEGIRLLIRYRGYIRSTLVSVPNWMKQARWVRTTFVRTRGTSNQWTLHENRVDLAHGTSFNDCEIETVTFVQPRVFFLASFAAQKGLGFFSDETPNAKTQNTCWIQVKPLWGMWGMPMLGLSEQNRSPGLNLRPKPKFKKVYHGIYSWPSKPQFNRIHVWVRVWKFIWRFPRWWETHSCEVTGLMWGCLTTGEEIILMASVGHYPICVGANESHEPSHVPLLRKHIFPY